MAYMIRKSEAERVERLLQKNGKKLLFYHNDPDGICSAAMLLRFFPGLEAYTMKGPVMGRDFVKSVVDKKPVVIVFVDLPVDQEWKTIEKMQKAIPGMEIAVIDHHIYDKDLNSKRILHINPRFEGDFYIPASYVVYKLLKKMGRDVKLLVWIAAIGIIGDYGLDECKDVLGECRRRYPKLLGSDALRSKLGTAAEFISRAVALKGNIGAKKSLEFLLKSEKFEEFISVPELGGWKREVDEEFERIVRDSEQNVEKHGNVFAFTINTKLGLNSAVATYFSEKYPDNVIIIRRRKIDQWKLSLRCGSGRVDVGTLTKKAVKSIGTGGGHKKAAGAMVKDLRDFYHS